jgi:hypothetical protein
MPREVVECDHCEQPIVILPTVWGEERPLRPFEPAEVPIGDVGPRHRYAFSKRRGGVVRLEHGLPVGSRYLPARSLVPHYCGRGLRLGDFSEYLTKHIDEVAPGMGEILVSWIKDGPPARAGSELPPEERRGMGFRRGLGKRQREEEGASLQRLRDAAENISKPRNPPSVDESVEEAGNGQN